MRVILYSEIKKEMPNGSALGSFNSALKNSTVKDVFSHISMMNTRTNTVSSIGTYASNLEIGISENLIKEAKSYVGKETTAFNILDNAQFRQNRGYSFSDKQLWAVSYELKKNKKYMQKVTSDKLKLEKKENLKKLISANKKAASADKYSANKDIIKSSGKKLTDYYSWLNQKGNKYRSEFFSKKYSKDSASAFLNEK